MGLFSKIFGGSEDGDGAAAEPGAEGAASAAEPKQPAAAAPRKEQPSQGKNGVPAPQQQNTKGPSPGAGQTVSVQGGAEPRKAPVPSQRPAIPQNVEAQLLSTKPQAAAPARVTARTAPAAGAAKNPAPVAPAPAAIGKVVSGAEPAAAPKSQRKAASASKPESPAKQDASPRAEAAAKPEPSPSTVRGTGPVIPAAVAAATRSPSRTPETLALDPIEPPRTEVRMRAPAPPDTEEIDSAFGRIVEPSVGPKPPAFVEDKFTKEANAALFRQMAVEYALPLREFMFELLLGPTSKQWVDAAKPTASSLLRAARELGEPALASAIEGLSLAIDRALEEPGPKITATDREALIAAYERLARELPEAFDVAQERSRREPLVVQYVLLQVPGMNGITIEKLFGAGLTSLDALRKASAADLVQLARIEADSAEAIVRRFRAYVDERAAHAPAKVGELAKKKLARLLDELRRAHEAFLDAEDSEDRSKKRDARAMRRVRALEMNVVLAELGEVDLVEELERSPTERRIEMVQSFIETKTLGALGPRSAEA